MKRILLFFSLTIVLMSCSTIKQGQVESKRDGPARYETRAAIPGFTTRTCQVHDDEDYVMDVGLETGSGRDDIQKEFVNNKAFDSLSINQDYFIENKRKSKIAHDKLNDQVAHFIIYFMTFLIVFVLSGG